MRFVTKIEGKEENVLDSTVKYISWLLMKLGSNRPSK
jgi:hypothetical protein